MHIITQTKKQQFISTRRVGKHFSSVDSLNFNSFQGSHVSRCNKCVSFAKNLYFMDIHFSCIFYNIVLTFIPLGVCKTWKRFLLNYIAAFAARRFARRPQENQLKHVLITPYLHKVFFFLLQNLVPNTRIKMVLF